MHATAHILRCMSNLANPPCICLSRAALILTTSSAVIVWPSNSTSLVAVLAAGSEHVQIHKQLIVCL
jgi:hypothetical protein